MGRIDDVSLAYALLRITLGLNIFMHGVSRLLAGLGNFVTVMAKTFENTPVPTTLVVIFSYGLPWLEGLIGLLILIGLRTRESLLSGAVLMLLLTFGTALRQDWNVAAIQLLYSIVYALLIAGLRHNAFSVDEKLFSAPRRGIR